MPDPVLPTAVIGSYSMPGWLERAKNDYLHRRMSRHDLDEIHDAAVKAAIKDQEVAGVDIVSDGELRRDNMIDYFASGCPACRSISPRSGSTTTSTTAWSAAGCPPASLGLVDEFRFLRRFTERRAKVSVTGPHTLVKRIRNEYYPSEEALRARHRARDEPRAERAGAGRRHRHPDRRAVLLGLPRGSALGDPRRQRAGRRRRGAPVACTSATATATASRRGRAATAICSRRSSRRASHQLTLEFAPARRRGPAAVQGVRSAVRRSASASSTSRRHDVETPGDRRRAHPAGARGRARPTRLVVNPDCGCCTCPRDVAFAKLCAMVEGTRLVRKELRRRLSRT